MTLVEARLVPVGFDFTTRSGKSVEIVMRLILR